MKNQNFGKPLSQLITMVAICMLSLNAMAYDFPYTYQGKTLYYNITSSNTVEVTSVIHVSGNIVIPSSVEYNNETYIVTSIGNYAFSSCSNLTSITIPNTVISIGVSAFGSCRALRSITIPNSITSIGGSAFSSCSSLTSIIIPNSITSINNDLFNGCSSLISVTIPNSVTSIGSSAFNGCSSLISVTIPNSVTSIGYQAFRDCSSLTSVTIPNSVTSIGSWAFNNCRSLTTINFDAVNCSDFNSNADYQFKDCPITTIIIGNSVQRIPAYFAENLNYLTLVDIGSNVTSIGSYAFYYCNRLTSIISNAILPPTIGSSSFLSNNNCNVTVPCGSLEAYTSSEWNNYFPNRITEGLTFDLSVTANDDSFGSVSVQSQSCNVKTLTATPNICYRFVSWNDGNTDNPRTIMVTSDTSFTAIFESVELSSNITAAICEGSTYTENGFNVSEAGVYTQNLQTINGCDSTVTLTLTVNPVATTTLQAAICEGTVYTENGFNVSEAGIYTQNLQTINGCDSTVTLTLTVNPVATTNLTAAICEGTVYAENGFNVSEVGVYTQNLQTINGCDSTVTLTLTVNPVATTTLQAAICEGTTYTENGFNVSEAGVYTQNLQTINGCDSTVTLTLTVNPVATTTLQAAICEGTAYTENGFNVSEAGVYTQNLQTINGCDSTVTLTLSVNPVATTNLTAAICEGSTYAENGFNVSQAGVYTQHFQTANGCDSTVTLTLTVNPTYSLTIDATINQGDVYQENGFEVSEAGTYTQNLQSVNGCDSVIVLNLTVNSSLGDVAANTIEVALFPNPAGDYTVLKVQGLKEQTKVALFDVRGRKLREFDLSAGTESIRLDLRDLPSGVYTLMIGNTTKKLIVE